MFDALSKKRVLFLLVALLILLTVLSMRVMRTSSLWYDEIWSLKCAGGAQYGPSSVGDIIECVRVLEANPPGYHLILWAWGNMVGWSEFALWMLSLLVGLITVASMYRLGHDLFVPMGEPSARMIGVAGAAIFGLSAFYLQFFYELRVYVFIILGTIWFLWFYWKLRQASSPSVLIQAAFVLTITGLLYLHFLMPLIIFPVALYHLVAVKKNRLWWRVPLLMAAGALLFLPWIPVMLKVTDIVAPLSDFRRTPLQMVQLVSYVYSNNNIGLLALIGVFALSAAALKQQATRFLWAIFVVDLIAGLTLVQLFSIVNRARYLLHLWPLAALLLALAVELLRQRRVNPLFFLAIWGLAGLPAYLNPTLDNIDHNLRLPWRSLQVELRTHAQPGDAVLFHTPVDRLFETLEFEYYSYGLPIHGSLTENIPGQQNKDEYFNQAQQFVGDAPRVWLGVDQSSPQNFRLGEVQRLLAADYTFCYSAFDIPWQMRLELYARKHPAPALRFGDASSQVDLSLLAPLDLDSDKTLNVLLSISHPATLPLESYSIGLHVEDSTGQLRAQGDFGVPDDLESCHRATVSLKDLPPGQYTVRIVVYSWRDGHRVPGQTLATGANEERPILGTITIN